MSSPLMTATPTPLMASVSLSFVDVLAVADHVVHLLQTQGKTALEIVTGMLKLIRAVSGRDMLGIFTALRELQDDVSTLVAAIKAEFQID